MGAPAASPVAICREGREDDRAYMLALAEKTFLDFGDYRQIIDQWLDAPRVQSFLLVEGEVRVGFALVAQHRGLGFWRSVSAELVAIALEPDARGRRLGSLLLRAVEDAALGWHAQEIRLHTATDNTAAQAFFDGAGYRVREGGVSYYPNGQTALELRRSLKDHPRAVSSSSR